MNSQRALTLVIANGPRVRVLDVPMVAAEPVTRVGGAHGIEELAQSVCARTKITETAKSHSNVLSSSVLTIYWADNAYYSVCRLKYRG